MNYRTGLALLMASLWVVGCAGVSGLSPQPSMKGMEIYSWQTSGGSWNYSLLAGTNRQKTVAEVTDPAQTLTCSCQLKTELGKLSTGEYVTWWATLPDDVNHVLGLPPQGVIADITAFCQQHQLNLQVVQ